MTTAVSTAMKQPNASPLRALKTSMPGQVGATTGTTMTTIRLDPPTAAQVAAAVNALIEHGTAAPLPGIEPTLVRRESA
ncbi:hypothetical protein [Streptomyces diastatochromogenes]|uniref:hypothetical protein n=1 Tax=Streptomyces diastatochromogenes TaxID=42236 RepID=UPI0036D1D120